MATPLKNSQNTPEVDTHATQQATLPRTALIGVFGPESALKALIRTADGRISRVAVGDRAAGGRVSAIGPSKVIIDNHTSTKVLAMPAT